MELRKTIISVFDEYLARSQVSPSAFGLAALKDNKFIPRLRAGKVTLRNIERALAYIEAHPPNDAPPEKEAA